MVSYRQGVSYVKCLCEKEVGGEYVAWNLEIQMQKMERHRDQEEQILPDLKPK